jgi:hypothetical protein
MLGLSLAAVFFGAMGALLGGEIALAGLLLVAVMAATLTDFTVGVIAMCSFLPLASTNLLPRQILGITGLNPLNVIVLGTAAAFVVSATFRRSRLAPVPLFFWAYIAVLVFAGLNGARSVHKVPPFLQEIVAFGTRGEYLISVLLKPLLALVATYLVAQAALDRKNRAVAIFVSAICGMLVLAAASAANIATGGYSLDYLAAGRRGAVSAFQMHANEVGLAFNIAFAVGLYVWSRLPAKSALKVFLSIALAILGASVLLTFSRGAFLALGATVVVFLLSRRNYRLMFLGAVVSACILALLPVEFYERLMTGVSEGNVQQISAGRVYSIWLPLLPDILATPPWGSGLSSTSWASANVLGRMLAVGHPHNAYLALWMDFGLFGSMVVVWFFFRIWRSCKQLGSQETDPFYQGLFEGARGALIVLLIQHVTDGKWVPAYHHSVFWIAVGILLARMAVTDRQPRKRTTSGSTRKVTPVRAA